MSAYLALAQMIPSDITDGQDHLYALFHPLLAISVLAPANDQLPACPIQFLLDTRASTTFVDPKLAVKLGWSVQTSAVQMKVRLAGGKAGPVVSNTVVGSFSLGGKMYQINGVIMDLHRTYDGILGLNFFVQHGLLANANSFVHLLEAGGANLSALGLQKEGALKSKIAPATLHNMEIHLTTLQLPWRLGQTVSQTSFVIFMPSSTMFSVMILGMCETFPLYPKPNPAFTSKSTSSKVPHCIIHHLIMYPEALLPRFFLLGHLQHFWSPKGNGKFRMVCDFQVLNNVTVPDMYPMGNVQDILHCAARKGRIFAKLDCKDAFFQTLMREEDIPKTTITTLLGLLEWVIMPQGIQNAPTVQQHQINEALQGLTGECCEVYVDDIIIWGKNAKDLHDNILFLNEVSFLGHIICPGQILPDPKKIACVEQFPIPTCSQQLHSFLGLINYLHDFVPNLATHTAVLHAALPPNTAVDKAYYKAVKMHKGHLPDGWTGWTWSFGPAEQAAFEAVRCAVSTVPCHTVIDYDAVKAGTQQVFLFTDASNTGTGAWIGVAPDLLRMIAQGYQGDVLFKEWLADPSTAPGVTVQEHDSYRLLLVNNRLCIPDTDNLCENLMHQAHEGTAAHLGLEKTLEVLRDRYFWDTMSKDTPYKVGDWVWLDTRNRLKEFQAGDGELRAAKFFPRFQGPYQVQEANPTLSVYRLHMNDKTYPKFHGHLHKPYLASPRFHQTSPLIPTPHSNLSSVELLRHNHIDRITHEDAASQIPLCSNNNNHLNKPINTSSSGSSDVVQLPHPIAYYYDPLHPLPYYRSPAGRYVHDVFHQENHCFDCHKPRINQLDTELTAGDTMSAYLALAQMIPSDITDGQDHLYALFHPLLAISVLAPANDQLPACPIQFLLDTRASTTFVDPKLAVKLGWSVQTSAVQMKVRLAGGKAGPVVSNTVVGSFSLGGKMYQINGVIMDLHRTYDGILGLNFFVQHGLLANANSFVHLLEAGGANLSALGLQKEAAMAAGSDSLTDILCHLHAKFHNVFCDDLGDQGATLHHSPPYHVPEALLPRFCEMLLEHLNAGRLRYSSSPWASPAFLVSKGNGKFRMVCDFQVLNNVTVPDMYPMGNVQDILHCAARKGRIFAKLDCKDAFFQTLMREEDIPKTTITTLLGLLEWVIMPQGIQNAPTVQQHQINEALQGLTGECCEVYVDDIIIWGKNAKDLHDNILFLNEVSFLGHIICPGQILPDPKKIACVEQFPIPTCSQQLHSFLGLINYLHDFVPNLATHTAVLHAALPPNTAVDKAYYKAVKMHKGHLPDGWTGWTWSFGPAEQAAFEAVRCAVSTVPCHTVIDYDAVKAGTQQVFLFTDASNTGTGAWIGVAPDLLRMIAQGYQGDVLFKEWLADPSTAPGVTVQEHDSYRLLLVNNRLCIPDTDNLCENLMHQAHEGTAAHLGLEKTLEVLRDRYFWDTMSKDTPPKRSSNALSECSEAHQCLHVLPKASHVPIFTGPLNDASTVLRHADHLHNLPCTHSLLTPLDDPQREENRHVSILEVTNNSVDCAGLLAWVDNVGQMMETDGKSNWDEWVAAFKDAALPLEWAVSEQRSLHHLQFATAHDWPAFDAQATQHRCNLMDHELYTLFHPPLVIQVSAATDRHTSTAPSHPLHFLLDTGAGTSFFDPSVVAKLGWKVRKNAVERTVQLAGGKPGLVVRDVTGGSLRV
ncbi:hypothetical protein D1P53_002502 [Cryptococcus gattii VGV]|nr:hypothetical protein D1P53_002502 [Cryptococcus gattii VGV]